MQYLRLEAYNNREEADNWRLYYVLALNGDRKEQLATYILVS